MKTRRLGLNGPEVSELSLGCMGMSWAYGPADETESIATIREALDSGVTLLDTGDFYGMGHNEMLIARALEGRRREDVFIEVKTGPKIAPDGSFIGIDCSPSTLKNSLSYSLRRLKTDYVDLYQPARVDPAVPIEETVGAISDLIRAGHVRYAGLSEVSVDTIRRAHAVHPIAALQIEYAILTRGVETQIIPTLRELGISLVAYGVLSRGLISDHGSSKPAATGGDFRPHLPRFQGENLQINMRLVDELRKIAEEKGISVVQLSIAWVLSRGEDILPLIGSRRSKQLQEALKSLDVTLTAGDLDRIDRAVPAGAVAGDRYAAAQMAALDSERSMS